MEHHIIHHLLPVQLQQLLLLTLLVEEEENVLKVTVSKKALQHVAGYGVYYVSLLVLPVVSL